MKNRDMFYQNVNQGFSNQGQYIPPSGYNMNTAYQAYGPNVMLNQNNQGMGYMGQNMNSNYQSYEDYISDRLDKMDKQIKNLDTRLQKLETSSNTTTDNIYMI